MTMTGESVRWRRLLIGYRRRAGLSQNAMAKLVGCNASYVNRLESGEREAPRRPMVVAIAAALGLSDPEREELILAAGYVPDGLVGIGMAELRMIADLRVVMDAAREAARTALRTAPMRVLVSPASSAEPMRRVLHG